MKFVGLIALVAVVLTTAAPVGKYPEYAGSLTVTGQVAIKPASATEVELMYELSGLEANVSAGIHIHVGKSCAVDAGAHLWDNTIDPDPWLVVKYTADKDGKAKGSAKVVTGLPFKNLTGHAVVVHSSTDKVGCAVLANKDDDDDDDDKKTPETGESCEEKAATCPTVAECEEGKKPRRENCCLSCKPLAPPVCTEAQRDACQEAMKTMAACSKEQGPRFNRTTCCPNCKHKEEKPEGKECDKEARKKCYDATTAVKCQDGEKPMKVEGSCCLSCTRPERTKENVREVAKCAKVPYCADGQQPAQVADSTGGFQCPSCKLPKLKCNNGCGNSETCARKKEGEKQDAAKCFRKKVRKYIFKAISTEDKAFLKNATAEEVATALKEIVLRFCDIPENLQRCSEKQTVIDSLVAKIVAKFGQKAADEVEVEVEIADAKDATARRLLAGDDLLNQATSFGSEATGGLTITVEGTGDMNHASTMKVSSFAAAALAVAAAAIVA